METLQAVRDVAIIILAIETIIVSTGVLLVLWQVWRLVGVVRTHVDRLGTSSSQVLGTLRDTAQTTSETAHDAREAVGFVAGRSVLPVIQLYSTIVGASRFAEALLRTKQR
ncbi:MAG: hypothetical protein GEU73_08690 [Chloroflexi bacterium]|nr:hypothetical protein [Chloroflexota bacterium]